MNNMKNMNNNLKEVMAVPEGENLLYESATRTVSPVNSIGSIDRYSPVRNIVRPFSPEGQRHRANITRKNNRRALAQMNTGLFKPESVIVNKLILPPRITVSSERIKGIEKKPAQRRLTIGGRGRRRTWRLKN